MKVVEVVDGLLTAAWVGDALVALARRMGHTPVRAQDTPGFIVNHAGRGFGTEALRLPARGRRPVLGDRPLPARSGGVSHGAVRADRPHRAGRLAPGDGIDLPTSTTRNRAIAPRRLPRSASLPGVSGANRRTAGSTSTSPVVRARCRSRPCRTCRSRRSGSRDTACTTGSQRRSRSSVASSITATARRPDSLCLVAPLGLDATSAAIAEGIDATRTVAVDGLFGLDNRRTLMTTPATAAGDARRRARPPRERRRAGHR